MSIKSIARAITPPILSSAIKHLAPHRQPPAIPPVAAPLSSLADPIALGHVNALLVRFPELGTFGMNPTVFNAGALTDFYSELLPLTYEPARGAHIRNALFRLRQKLATRDLDNAIERAIAITELEANTCPDRATILQNDPEYGAAWAAERDKVESAYGAPLLSQAWPDGERGATLIHFFRHHPDLLRGKNIYHLAPEPNLRDWIRTNGQIASYASSDAYGDMADENQDITAIAHPDSSFDVILCHRVMEHVLDDRKGFSELYRILRRGGLVSFSVPQAPQRPQTSEWVVPDLTHNAHLRHYGADLEERVRAAGFDVRLEPWLLTRDRDELLAAGAYPMRIFHLWK